uniref:4-coumarate--CoA ligase 3 n=1 Tax=Panagrellus redivivus TaxID=6233 RepID=A0A7E4W181_PANRE
MRISLRSNVFHSRLPCRKPVFTISVRTLVHKSPYEFYDATENGKYTCFAKYLLGKVWQHSVENPGKAAFINAHDPSKQRTFRDVYVNALSIATYLYNAGVRRGDTVSVLMPNSIDTAAIVLGTTIIGGVFSPISASFTPAELIIQLNDSKSKVLFVHDKLAPVAAAARPKTSLEKVIIVDGVATGDETNFSDVVKTLPSLDNRVDAARLDDLFCLPYSSGTTGLPKGVMLTQKNLFSLIDNVAIQFKNEEFPFLDPPYTPKVDNELLLLPFFHIFGQGMLLKSILQGGTAVVMSIFKAEEFFKIIQDFKLRFIAVAPPIALALTHHPAVDNYDISSLQAVFSGGAPLASDVGKALQKRHKNIKYVVQGYGMTESSLAISLPCLRPGKVTPSASVGQLVAGYEAKIVDIDTKEVLTTTNAVGELWVRSPLIMKGYHNRPEETAHCLDDEGWFKTGDMARFDDEGHLFIEDRLKELIKVSAYQVPPAELEHLMHEHPEILDVAVIGVPCDRRGEVPKAFVVRKSESLTEDAVKEFVAERVSHYKQLNGGVSFVDAIPKSPAGKILRRELKKLL